VKQEGHTAPSLAGVSQAAGRRRGDVVRAHVVEPVVAHDNAKVHTPACGRFIHPSQDRGITLREAARLQTIPDWYDFGGSSAAAIGGMIGDAVPVELAAWTARRLLAVLPPIR